MIEHRTSKTSGGGFLWSLIKDGVVLALIEMIALCAAKCRD